MNKIIIFLFLILFGCKQNKTKDADVFYSKPISFEELVENYRKFNISRNSAIKAAEIGVFIPNDTNCTKKIEVLPPLSFDFFDLKSIQSEEPKEILYAYLEKLYKLFGDPTVTQNESYDYNNISINYLVDSLVSGNWAPQCGGISNITNRLIEEHLSQFNTGIIHLDYPIHTVSSIHFNKGDSYFSLIFDTQNGYIFPVDINNEFVPVNVLSNFSENEIVENLYFLWLDEKTLLKKRNLLKNIMPCNLLVDNLNVYHHSQNQDFYKFDRLSYSFHKYLWFDLKTIDTDSMKIDIIEKILEN